MISTSLFVISGLTFSYYSYKKRKEREEKLRKAEEGRIIDYQGKRVAIFGLSANPPTGENGHQGIIRHLVQKGMFDEIWVLPVYHHILKEGVKMASYEDRINMCKLAFEGESSIRTQIKVLELEKEVCLHFIEKNSQERVGTIDILRHIHSRFRNIELYLVLGGDTFFDLSIGKWKQHNSIPELCQLYVIGREFDFNKNNEQSIVFQSQFAHKIIFSRFVMMGRISSSSLRLEKPWNEVEEKKVGKGVIHPKVFEYIRQHHVYSD